MPKLDPRTLQDLEQLRQRGAPSAASKQRIHAALELRLGSGSGGDGPPDEGSGGLEGGAASSTTKAGLGYAAKVVGATLALTVTGLVGVRLAVLGARAMTDDGPGDPVTVVSDSRPPSSTQAPAPAPAPKPSEQVDPLPAAPSPAHAVDPPARSKPATHSSKATEHDADQLAAEMALLEAAHAAKSPKAALAELERHRARFPDGQLRDEREILQVEALCELDELDRAQAIVDGLLKSKQSSALRPRLAAACPQLVFE